jgi:hypothetical protein
VLHVTPEDAEYWDTRGNSIVVALKLAAARLAGLSAPRQLASRGVGGEQFVERSVPHAEPDQPACMTTSRR